MSQIGFTDGDLNMDGVGGLPFGELWVLANAVETAIGGAGTFVQFVGFVNNGQSNNTTPDHTNDNITIIETGKYLVTVSIHVESIGAGAADTISAEVRKNNGTATFSNLHAHRKLAGGGGDIGSVSISGIASLTAADTVELWVANDSNATNLLLADCNLSILKIGG